MSQTDLAPATRSRITNGAVVLDGIDGRTAAARRFKDIFAEVLSDLGGVDHVTEGQRQLAKRAAGLSVGCELIEAAMTRGEEIDLEDYTRLINATCRTFTTIGLKRCARDITPDPLNYVNGPAKTRRVATVS